MRQRPTSILDFEAPAIQDLIRTRGWRDRPPYERIGAVYSFVKDEIVFGYNRSDDLAASEVEGPHARRLEQRCAQLLERGRTLFVRERGDNAYRFDWRPHHAIAESAQVVCI